MAEQARGHGPAIRWGATALVLLALLWWLDIPELMTEFGRFQFWVVLPALGFSVVQVCVSAWRWRFTARCLGLQLPFAVAVREYYLATFLNQVLPGGVMGDVNRAWRHSLNVSSRLASVHAVVIERLSGQLVLVVLAAVLIGTAITSEGGGVSSMPTDGSVSSGTQSSRLLIILLCVTAAIVVVAVLRVSLLRYGRQLVRDLRTGLLGWPVGMIQLASSLMVVGSYLAVFAVLALGAGYLSDDGSFLPMMALCSGLLLSMVVPVTVAGWGVREGAAAALWPMAGLPAEQGVALSVGYGLMVLLSSLPGALYTFSSVATAR